MRPLKYQLVLQWPASSIDDYDAMISIEDALIEGLSDGSIVDGHDGGSGQVNIFILTANPLKDFGDIESILTDCGAWPDVRVAYRDLEATEYQILWPENLTGFTVI